MPMGTATAAMTAESDLALLRRFAELHDTQAFAEIVRRYAAMVFNACRRIVRDASLAEDVSQETFFRLMRRPESVSHSVGAWLHQAATNLAVDAVRSDSARRRREHAYAEDASEENGEASLREVQNWAELSPIVDEALSELPNETRNLLVAHFLCGRPQNELAAEAGTSAATMCRRIKAGVEALQSRLRDRGITMAPLALMGLLGENGLQTAAPKTLLTQLGKMTMVSGWRRWFMPKTATVAGQPPIFWTAASILGASVIVGILCALLYTRTLPTRWIPSPSARVIFVDQPGQR